MDPEHARKATDLVLKQLEDDLKRGDVDDELLKELGWTEQDLARFSDRMREQLEQPTDVQNPGEVARQQEFEEMLKNLRFEAQPNARTTPSDRVREVEGVGTRRAPVPAAFRDAYEAYTRGLNGTGAAADQPATP